MLRLISFTSNEREFKTDFFFLQTAFYDLFPRFHYLYRL